MINWLSQLSAQAVFTLRYLRCMTSVLTGNGTSSLLNVCSYTGMTQFLFEVLHPLMLRERLRNARSLLISEMPSQNISLRELRSRGLPIDKRWTPAKRRKSGALLYSTLKDGNSKCSISASTAWIHS